MGYDTQGEPKNSRSALCLVPRIGLVGGSRGGNSRLDGQTDRLSKWQAAVMSSVSGPVTSDPALL